MKRVQTWGFFLISAISMLLAGCGGDDTESLSARMDDGPGKPVKSTKQLVGAWYGPAAKDIAGFEFTEGGQVMITFAGGNPLQLGGTVMWNYGLLDGGRVALSQPNGQTRIMAATISGKTLALAAEHNPNEVARYLKLDEQSIAQAHQAESQRLIAQHDKMLQAVHDYLQQPKLVLVSDIEGVNPGREALEISGAAGNWSGKAYTEISAPILRTAQVSLLASSPGLPIQLEIALLETVGPPGQSPVQPRAERLVVEGAPDKLKIAGGGRKLVADGKVYDDIVKKYEEVRKERETALTEFTEQFGAYAWLQGGYHYLSGRGAEHNRIAYALRRVEGQPAFEFVQVNRNTDPDWNLDLKFNAYQQIPVLFSGDKPVLRLPDQTVLTANSEGGKTVFRGKNRAGQDAEFIVADVVTAEDVASRQAVVNEYLAALRETKTLRGHIITAGSNGHVGGRILTVTADPQGNISGSLKALEYGGTYAVTGKFEPTFLGAAMQLQSTELLNGPYNRMMEGRIKVDLVFDFAEGADAPPVVSGKLGGGFLSGELTFSEISAAQIKAEREQLIKWIAGDGSDFTPVQPRHNRGQPLYRIKADPASGKITGTISEGPNNLLPNGPVSFTGQLSEQDGYVYIHLENPAERNDNNRAMRPWEHFIWAIPTAEQGLVLAGATALHSGISQGKFDPRPLVLLPAQGAP